MPTIAIIGAGPGLGLATARRFGREGFSVALVSRTQANVDRLAEQLTADGITARGYAANARDLPALRAALDTAASDLGAIEVLQYSPVPAKDFMRPVLETTAEDLIGPIEQSVYAPVAAVQHVLPGMQDLGRGTILFPNGSSAATPNGNVTGTSVAFAGESAYGQMLHDALKPEGIHVAQLIIPGGIDGGDPLFASDALADRLWDLHAQPGPFRATVGDDEASAEEATITVPGTPIRITLDGQVIEAVLHDNPAANALRDMLPLDLDVRDYAGQEVLADLPARLTMDGMPRGCDPEIADIGYNHSGQVIVFHYSKIGFWPGTAVLGHMDVDVSVFQGWDGSTPVRIEVAD